MSKRILVVVEDQTDNRRINCYCKRLVASNGTCKEAVKLQY
jgi:hypothetical protein